MSCRKCSEFALHRKDGCFINSVVIVDTNLVLYGIHFFERIHFLCMNVVKRSINNLKVSSQLALMFDGEETLRVFYRGVVTHREISPKCVNNIYLEMA